MSPANSKPVRPWAPDRHIDVNGDLHLFFDWLVAGKTVLDVGAGLGKSKARVRHSRVVTYDPSPAATVDLHSLTDHAGVSLRSVQVVTAFEVIEHVEHDVGFCCELDRLAAQAVFLTTPNWAVARCQSADHHREYTHAEWEALVTAVWPDARHWWGAYYKDAEGGYCRLHSLDAFRRHAGLKHLVLVDKGLSDFPERVWLRLMQRRAEESQP